MILVCAALSDRSMISRELQCVQETYFVSSPTSSGAPQLQHEIAMAFIDDSLIAPIEGPDDYP